MLIIGLTGGVASGKSTVLGLFGKQGCKTIDVDSIVRELTKPGKILAKQIRSDFGDEYFNTNGVLDRKKLGNAVFANKQARIKINRIIHPTVIKRIKKIINKFKHRKGILVIEVPLLFEVGLERMFDRIVLCYLPLEFQISRLMKKRDISKKEAISMIKSQDPLSAKIGKSDFIIDARYRLKRVAKQVKDVCNILKENHRGIINGC